MDTHKTRHEVGEALQACAGFVLLVLVFTGMSGTIYKLLSPEGWIVHAFGRGFSAGIAALVAIFGIAFVAWFSRVTETTRTRQHAANTIVYLFAFAGFVYLAQFWTRGAL